MDTKIFLLASLAGGVTFFVSGYVFYGVLLHNFMVASSAAGVIKRLPEPEGATPRRTARGPSSRTGGGA